MYFAFNFLTFFFLWAEDIHSFFGIRTCVSGHIYISWFFCTRNLMGGGWLSLEISFIHQAKQAGDGFHKSHSYRVRAKAIFFIIIIIIITVVVVLLVTLTKIRSPW